MDTFRKIIAGICAVLLVICGVTALLAFNIERQAFTSAAYRQAFENQNLYERMPEILAGALHTSITENVNADPYLKSLTIEDWKAAITSLLPPEELKALTDNALDSVFDYLNGKTDSAIISLLPFKRLLAGPAGLELVHQILQAQPACTAEQLLQIGFGFLGGDIMLCNPPAELLGLMTPLIASQLQVMTITFPDNITLIAGTQNGTREDPRLELDRIRAFMKMTPFFPLFFLFGITIFAVRNLMDWLQWWGYPFLITGAISALTASIGSSALGFIIQYVIQNQIAKSMPPILLSSLRETVSTVTEQMLEPVAIDGLILAALGLGMVIVAAYLTKKLISYLPSK